MSVSPTHNNEEMDVPLGSQPKKELTSSRNLHYYPMKSSAVLKELKQLKEDWSKQYFKFTDDQQKRYDKLLVLRRKRVKEMYANDRVHKGPSNK